MGNEINDNLVHDARALGQLVRRRRKLSGLTIAKMAAMLGVSPRFLGELERGRGTVPVEKMLQALQAVGVDLIARSRS